jgi:hypothetical protein
MPKVNTKTLPDGTIISDVFDTGYSNTAHLSFSTSSPDTQIFWRGQTTIFKKNNKKPIWEKYKTRADKDWRYIQVKIIRRKEK